MNITEYANKVVSKLKELRPDLLIDVNEHVKKNNGMELVGISIHEQDNCISPMIYIERYYGSNVNIDVAANDILELYERNAKPCFEFDIDTISNFDNVKDSIVARLVNKEKNDFIIDEVPYAQFGDMIVTFVVVIQNDKTGVASARVTNQMMNTWKINLAQLIEVAYENTRKLFPMEIGTMKEVMEKMIRNRKDIPEEMVEELLSAEPGVDMYIVSNKQKSNGSYYITDRQALLDVAKYIKDNKFYILPSSVHEFIVIPESSGEMDTDYMLDMVKEVNANEVPCDEVLADNVYMFDADLEELRTVSGTVIPFIA